MSANTLSEVGPSKKANACSYFDRSAETMSRDELEGLQFDRLRKTLRNAYDNVSLHRRRMEQAGVVPEEVRTLDDLRRIPFTYKTDLRDTYPFGMFARPLDGIARLHASSGTTGKATVVGYTKDDIATWAELMARSLHAAGARPGDVIHNAYGYGLFTGGLGAHYGAERLGATVVPMSGGSTERQIALIMDLGATVLCATPSYALAMAEVAEQQGVDLRKSKLRVGVFGAEPWSSAMRSQIEERLAVKAIDIYGLSEIMGPGVACECAAQSGLHGWEDHFLFELLDPETQVPVPDGNAGELVISTLTKQALPMLRYRTRDITRLTTAPCDCGRTHVRILRITGRSDDMLIIRGVNVYPSQIESVLVGRPMISPHYQLVVERRGTLDDVTIEVEALSDVDEEAFPSISRDIAHHVKSMVGISTDVVVKLPGEIPRSQGKAVRVRDLRPKE
jgi:phenylacetate-CoA ligase